MYPVQNVLTSKIRQQAAKQNNGEYMSLWAGQASSLARIESAQHVVERVMKEADNAIEQLQNVYRKDHLNNSSGLFISLLYKIVGWPHRYKPSLSNLSACDLLRSIYHTHDLRSQQLDSQLLNLLMNFLIVQFSAFFREASVIVPRTFYRNRNEEWFCTRLF